MFRLTHLFATNMLVLQLTFILWPAPCGQLQIQEHEKNRLDAGPSQVVCCQVPKPGVGCPESESRKYGHPRMVPPPNGISYGVSSPSTTSTRYNSAAQRVLSRGEQRPAEPRLAFDGEQRLTDRGPRIDLRGICSCCIVGSVPSHTLEMVDSGNLNGAYTLSPGGCFILPVKPLEQAVQSSKADQAVKTDRAYSERNAIKISIGSKQAINSCQLSL